MVVAFAGDHSILSIQRRRQLFVAAREIQTDRVVVKIRIKTNEKCTRFIRTYVYTYMNKRKIYRPASTLAGRRKRTCTPIIMAPPQVFSPSE